MVNIFPSNAQTKFYSVHQADCLKLQTVYTVHTAESDYNFLNTKQLCTFPEVTLINSFFYPVITELGENFQCLMIEQNSMGMT